MSVCKCSCFVGIVCIKVYTCNAHDCVHGVMHMCKYCMYACAFYICVYIHIYTHAGELIDISTVLRRSELIYCPHVS